MDAKEVASLVNNWELWELSGSSLGARRSCAYPGMKLSLNDKLRNAFCTQAGLSAEAVDRIWKDAQGNE